MEDEAPARLPPLHKRLLQVIGYALLQVADVFDVSVDVADGIGRLHRLRARVREPAGKERAPVARLAQLVADPAGMHHRLDVNPQLETHPKRQMKSDLCHDSRLIH